MDSRNDYLFPKENLLISKVEPIDIDFIKKEKIEEGEECFVVQGIVEPLEIDKVSVKKELCENEEIENYSSANV